MTLIITVRSKSHIVVTADGRCRTITNGIQSIKSDSLQKIFPLTNRGFAIAHHGENIIEGRKVGDIANEFLNEKMNTIAKSTVRNLTQLFVEKYGDNIRRTLEKIRDSKACGFLFFGFGISAQKPKIYEAFWGKNGTNKVVFEENECKDLSVSGDAKKYLVKYINDAKEKNFHRNNIWKGTIQNAKAYCDRLYQLAEDAQAKDDEHIFGGNKHQLVIKKSGCEWIIPPHNPCNPRLKNNWCIPVSLR